jgi:hypothetical protein
MLSIFNKFIARSNLPHLATTYLSLRLETPLLAESVDLIYRHPRLLQQHQHIHTRPSNQLVYCEAQRML